MQQLVTHEGLRLKPYTDTAGKVSIGAGRNLTDCGISRDEAELLLQNDIDAAVADLATFPWFPSLDAVRQRALVDLRFNTGRAGFLKFKKLIAAIGTGDYVRAGEELMKSKVAPNRKQTLARMLATGIGVLFFTTAAFAQTDFPPRAQAIVNTLYQAHPDLAGGTDDQRRMLTKIMAEQIRFELGPEWGTKSAGVGRPQSKDAIARLTNGQLFACDWQDGGTRAPFATIGCPAIPGQLFIAVDPVNHFDAPASPPIVVVPPAQDLSAQLLAELRAHEAADQAERMEAAKFRSDVRSVWKSALVTLLKYAAPAIGAIFVGRASK